MVYIIRTFGKCFPSSPPSFLLLPHTKLIYFFTHKEFPVFNGPKNKVAQLTKPLTKKISMDPKANH